MPHRLLKTLLAFMFSSGHRYSNALLSFCSNIGLPFYGLSFAGRELTKFGQANGGTADLTTWWADEGSPQCKCVESSDTCILLCTAILFDHSHVILDYNIASKLSGFRSIRDEPTKTQYAYNDWGFVSYDDERAICDKTEYAMDNNLNGYIIWEISGDLMPDLSTPLLDATNKRLNEPNVRCDGADPNVRPPTPLPTNPTQMPPVPVTTPNPSERLTAVPTMQPIPTLTLSPTHHETDTSIIPKDEDILFGRGARQHPGNMRLRETVDEFRTIYNRKYPSSQN